MEVVQLALQHLPANCQTRTFLYKCNKRPAYYVSAQIKNLNFYNEFSEDFVNIDVRYENHQEKL